MTNESSNLSQRAIQSLNIANPMKDALMDAWDYVFHPVNPVINLGVAQNDLMNDELSEKIPASIGFELADLNYGRPEGSYRLRQLVASTITRHFKPIRDVEQDHIIVTAGAGAAIFYLTMAVTDPGDSVLVVSPYYGNLDADVCFNSQVDLVPLYLNENGDDWDMHVDDEVLDQTFVDAVNSKGKRIKALLITNPHNPFGRCFSREALETLLQFASRHRLHVISDEVYGLSTFGDLVVHSHDDTQIQQEGFLSLLSFPDLDQVIDPSLVHVTYSISKDFCMNGLRMGFVIDQHNSELRNVLSTSAMFSWTSSISDRLISNILEDEAWVDHFLATNKRRLATAYKVAVEALEHHGLEFIPANAGHFITVDARALLKERNNGASPTIEDERWLWKTLLDRGVYIAAGHVFHTRYPGVFRVTFTIEEEKLRKGIAILAQVLQSAA